MPSTILSTFTWRDSFHPENDPTRRQLLPPFYPGHWDTEKWSHSPSPYGWRVPQRGFELEQPAASQSSSPPIALHYVPANSRSFVWHVQERAFKGRGSRRRSLMPLPLGTETSSQESGNGNRVILMQRWRIILTKWSRIMWPVISHVAFTYPDWCSENASPLWHFALPWEVTSVECFPQTPNCSLIMREHQTNPTSGTFYKMSDQYS